MIINPLQGFLHEESNFVIYMDDKEFPMNTPYQVRAFYFYLSNVLNEFLEDYNKRGGTLWSIKEVIENHYTK